MAWANEDLFMTSATEQDGTEDLINGFYKVAKPGEWISEEALKPTLCSKETVDQVFRDKLAKVYNAV